MMDDDDDYFLYSLRFHLPACYTRLFEKKLRLLGPSRRCVCSVTLGFGMVAHHHVFCGILPLFDWNIHTCFHERTFIEM